MFFNSHNLLYVFLLRFAFIHVPSRFPLREDIMVPRSREVRRSQGGHLGRTYRGRLGAKVWPGSHRHMAWNSGFTGPPKKSEGMGMAVLDQLELLKGWECGVILGFDVA